MFVLVSCDLVASSVEFRFQGCDVCKDVYFPDQHVPHIRETPEVIWRNQNAVQKVRVTKWEREVYDEGGVT